MLNPKLSGLLERLAPPLTEPAKEVKILKNLTSTPTLESDYNHSFPAIRGSQAGGEFYVAMCPMRLIPKIFVFDDEEVPAEMRAQRTLNRQRIPEIAQYLVDNRDSKWQH